MFASSSNGFAVIDADATTLTVSLVDGIGKTLYTDTLKKDRTSAGPGPGSPVPGRIPR